jgi:hypothetical protein
VTDICACANAEKFRRDQKQGMALSSHRVTLTSQCVFFPTAQIQYSQLLVSTDSPA